MSSGRETAETQREPILTREGREWRDECEAELDRRWRWTQLDTHEKAAVWVWKWGGLSMLAAIAAVVLFVAGWVLLALTVALVPVAVVFRALYWWMHRDRRMMSLMMMPWNENVTRRISGPRERPGRRDDG